MTAGDAARLFLDKAREDEAVLLKLAPDPDISDEPVGFHARATGDGETPQSGARPRRGRHSAHP